MLYDYAQQRTHNADSQRHAAIQVFFITPSLALALASILGLSPTIIVAADAITTIIGLSLRLGSKAKI